MTKRRRQDISRTNKKRRRIFKILAALAVLLFLCYPFLEAMMIETEERELILEDKPSDIESLRIVYLSDIHQGGILSKWRMDDLVSDINAMRPDIIILGGDYAKDQASAVDYFNSLPKLHARYAVFGVIGDTDRAGSEEGDITALTNAMLSAGVTPLVDTAAEVRVTVSSSVWVVGADDALTGSPDIQALAGKVRQNDLVIFTAHSPALIPEALAAGDREGRRNWFDLGLFGHTHGGQFPILGQLTIATEVNSRYRSGWMQENRIDLLISRGVGTEVFPVRLFCKPQLHMITIR